MIRLGGISVEAIAARFGTPAYAYDLDMVRERYRALRAALPPRIEIFYAVKANPCRAILHLLASEGAGADVASEGELLAARDAGIPGARLVLTGPAKSDAFLSAAVSAGVAVVHCEGAHELSRLAAIASKRGRRQVASLRLNPGWGIAEKRRIIGGPGAHKFGVDLETAETILKSRSRYRALDVSGFQVFNASNVLDARALGANARRVLWLASRLARERGLLLRIVDFGGGLGIPYSDGEAPLDLAVLQRSLADLAAEADRDPLLSGCRLVIEPGRWLVGPAGLYLTRVVECKVTRGSRHVLVDGGVHHMLRPALIGSTHRIEAVAPRRGARTPACVGGPLCTSLDVLHPEALLPPVGPGDLLVVRDAGAYGFTESMPLFLSHPWPAEVGIAGGRARLLRRPPSLRSLLGAQETM